MFMPFNTPIILVKFIGKEHDNILQMGMRVHYRNMTPWEDWEVKYTGCTVLTVTIGVLFSKNNSDLKPFMNGFRCHSTVNVIVHTNN